jgi:Transcriptional regulator, contains sigma factor-related N-terminal domain
MPTYETIRLINIILNLYYMDGLTQTEIAQRLRLSTAKVNRLLQQAREQGYVNITIRTPFQQLFNLENRLKAVFGLQEAIVIPTLAESGSSALNALGGVAANFLLEHLRDGDVLAITPGTTVHAVVQSLDASRNYQVVIVPILGAIQGQIESDMNFLATNMAERLGGKAYQLHAPAFVDTREQCELLSSMGPVKEILDIARIASIALLGIGTVDAETSRFVQFTALSAEDLKLIADSYGGVGEIAARVYAIDGQPCGQEYADRVIGLTLAEIHNIPFRIGVAATSAKALPIYGALRGGYLHALITDEAAACKVLDLFEQDFRNKS